MKTCSDGNYILLQLITIIIMIKKIFFTLAVLFTSGALMSVSAKTIISKGEQVVNLGIGLGSYYGGNGYSSSIPPISASYEKGVVDGLLGGKASIGVGGYLGYTANKWESTYINDIWGYKYSYLILGARGVFHYQLVKKLDTYAGLLLGYNVVSSKFYGDDDIAPYVGGASSASGIGYSAFLGARYKFNKKIGAYAELGYGISALELGVSIRL